MRRWSALRSENSMFAAFVAQRHTGENTSDTRVWEIGLGSSFRRCVTANAVAVATMSRSARIVGALRFIGARLYAAHAGGQPNDERCQSKTQADGDHVARGRHVQKLDAAERQYAGEAESERIPRLTTGFATSPAAPSTSAAPTA